MPDLYPAGIGPAGHAPPGDPSAAPSTQAGAAFFDPSTRDAVLLADGTYRATHPVDQAVCLALTIVGGTVASAPGIGQTISGIEYVSRGFEAEAVSRVRSALRTLTARGDITIESVAAERTDAGINLEVTYRNERLAGAPLRTVAVKG